MTITAEDFLPAAEVPHARLVADADLRSLLAELEAAKAALKEADAAALSALSRAGIPTPAEGFAVRLRPPATWREILRLILVRYRARAALGFLLMSSQAFLYNAIFFTYALMLTRFYGVPDDRVGLYIFPFALGNVLGPLLLGTLFDTVGRRTMIAVCYGVSGLAMLATGYLFSQDAFGAGGQALAWSAIFFFVFSTTRSTNC